MRKAIKTCLALAMVGTMALPALAAEKSAKAMLDVRTTFSQTSSKKAVKDAKADTNMDMNSYARIGVQATAKGDVWTTTGTAYIISNTDHSIGAREKYVSLANDSMKITFGYHDPTGVGSGDNYLLPTDNTEGAGSSVFGRQDQLSVALTDVGLTIALGINENTWDHDSSADTAAAQYRATDLGVFYKKALDALTVGVSYESRSTAIDENANGTSVKKTKYDGQSTSAIGLGVGYKMDKMLFSFNYDAKSQTNGTAGAKAYKTTVMELLFDMDLDDVSGITAGYTMVGTDDGSGVKGAKSNKTVLNVGYKTEIENAEIWAGYFSSAEKSDADSAETATASELAVMLRYTF